MNKKIRKIVDGNKPGKAIKLLDKREDKLKKELSAIAKARVALDRGGEGGVSAGPRATAAPPQITGQAVETKTAIYNILSNASKGFKMETLRKQLVAKRKRSYTPNSVITYLGEMKKDGVINVNENKTWSITK